MIPIQVSHLERVMDDVGDVKEPVRHLDDRAVPNPPGVLPSSTMLCPSRCPGAERTTRFGAGLPPSSIQSSLPAAPKCSRARASRLVGFVGCGRPGRHRHPGSGKLAAAAGVVEVEVRHHEQVDVLEPAAGRTERTLEILGRALPHAEVGPRPCVHQHRLSVAAEEQDVAGHIDHALQLALRREQLGLHRQRPDLDQGRLPAPRLGKGRH